MTAKKRELAIGLLPFLLLLISGCKKNPTTNPIEDGQQTIEVLCEPSSARGGMTIAVRVLIAGATKEMRVFGLDVAFDNKMFQFERVRSGTLTGTWAGIDGNEVSPGILRVGGFVGSGTPISTASQGSLAEIRFKVTGSEYGNGKQSQVCSRQYTDDLAGFRPETACAVFTLQK
jgi:hypothetical protein